MCVCVCMCVRVYVYVCLCGVLSVDSHVRQSHLNEIPSLCICVSYIMILKTHFPSANIEIYDVNTESMSTVSHC